MNTNLHSLKVTPKDIICGIGVAKKDFLCTCLALFDDGTIAQYFSRFYQDSKEKIYELTNHELEKVAGEVTNQRDWWLKSTYSEEQLRLFLWIYLREAFNLPARLSVSNQGATKLADDLSAAMVNFINPPPGVISTLLENATENFKNLDFLRTLGIKDSPQATEPRKPPSTTLADVVYPVLEDLFKSADVKVQNSELNISEEYISGAIQQINKLNAEDQERLRAELGVDELNRDAAIKILASGGSLAAISTGVSAAGFSAYILAAKASAFIPLVSGPGLVSFLAVISNPITMITGTVFAAWWFSNSAEAKIKANVASRVIALLAIQGQNSGALGMSSALNAFPELGQLSCPPKTIDQGIWDCYVTEWQHLKDIESPEIPSPSENVWEELRKPLSRKSPAYDSLSKEEKENAAALSALAVGDVLFSAASIDPTVVNATDFAYVADISSRFDFANLATAMMDKVPASALGEAARLKGYVAEFYVASQLAAEGHAVSFPDSASQPGWDLLVDGKEFQVKFRENLEGIEEALEKYNFPIIANTELMGQIPQDHVDKVFFVDGISNELVTAITNSSVAAGVDMIDGNLPLVALGISTFRGVKQFYAGNLTSSQAAEQILLDGVVRVGLFTTGGVVGAGAGFLLFGPAGAWVLGAGMPVLAQAGTGTVVTKIKEHAKFPLYEQWAESVHDKIDDFHKELLRASRQKRRQLQLKLNQTAETQTGMYVRWRLEDQFRFALENEKQLSRLDRSTLDSPELRFKQTVLWISRCVIHPALYQSKMKVVNDELQKRPGFMDEIDQEWISERMDGLATNARGIIKSAGDVVSSFFRK